MFDLNGSLLAWSAWQTIMVLCIVVILVAYYLYRRKQV